MILFLTALWKYEIAFLSTKFTMHVYNTVILLRWNSVTTTKRVFWSLTLSVYLKSLHTHLQYHPGGEKAVRKITSSGPESRQYITMWKVRSDWNGREWCKRSKIDIGARSSGSRWGHLSIFMASVGFFSNTLGDWIRSRDCQLGSACAASVSSLK